MNTFIIQLVITLVAAAAISLILIPLIIRMSIKLKLVDKPDERKVHKVPVPRLAGVAIFFSAIVAVLLSKSGLDAVGRWPILFSSVGLLFMLGIWDDLKNISARLRFVLQICSAAAIAASGIRLTSLYGIFGIYEIGIVAQYAISVLIMVGVTNAFNLIDGIDGLAGGLALISVTVLAAVALLLQQYTLVIIFAAYMGSLTGFLRYNFSPARIFMGDGGSLMLGFLISASGILLIELSAETPQLIAPSRTALVITALLVIPVFDTLRVFLGRMMKGYSPFKPDKTHIHHLFLVAGLNHRKTCYFLYSFALLLILIAIFVPNTDYMSTVIILMVVLFHIITEVLRVNQGVEKWLKVIRKMEKGELV